MSAFQDILRSPNLTSAQDLRLGLFLTFTNDSTDCRQDMHKLDSMRGLYRTFSMPKLETELIVSVKLAAAGFKEYPKIARKLKTLYECTSVQLSGSKRITALGMRNLMAVLQLASKAKVESEAFFGENKISEMDMVVRAIRTVNIPRMTAVDKGIFSATLGDIFAGVQAPVLAQLQGEPRGLGTQQRQAPTVTEQDLSDAISTLLRKQKMDKHATWMEKTLQLHAIMESNHGIMVLGAAALGKSSIITILQQAQQRLNADTHTYLLNKMNPKSLPVQQMFGWRSASADQWHDGTFSFLLRRAQSQPGITNWIVLDGPIDPIWAENLNTLLDDQKLLTLANGDRIGMKTLSRIIFESDKSDNASPATMARVGVVWVPSTALPWRSFVNKWIEGRGSEERVILRSLFDRYMDQLLHFQKMQCSPVVQTPATYVPWMLTRMFECASKFMDFRWDASGEVFLEKIFIFCLCWSFGGLLENMDRIKLSQFMYTLTDLLPNMKNDVTLFDFYPDDNVLDWEHWRTRIQDWKYPKQFDPTSIFVSTEDTCRTEFILRLLSSQRLNFLMTGATASCKSHNLRQFISSLDTEKHVATTVPLSQASTTHALLDHILNVIHKRQGRTYGPDPGKSCVIVVEDISLTPADKWGDQANCEVLRQLINEGGYYDLQKPTEWTSIMGLHYACVMTHPLSTHRDIPMRLKGQLCAFNLTMPSENSMNAALTKVFDKHFNRSKAPASVIKFAKMLPEATIALCKSLRQALVTNDSKIHYTFNLHDVMRVLTSVLHCRSVEMTTPELVLRLWRHDCERVFGDKLVSVDHRMVVLESIQHILQHKSFDEINRSACLEAQIERFGKFFRDGGSQEQNTAYGVLPDMDTIADNLEELQARKATTNFPLYDEAIEQIVRVARVLCMKRGSVILVGTLNSGRGPIVQLASEVANSICFDPSDLEMRGGGSHMDCLRNAYWIAGIDNKPVTVVLFIDKTKDDSLFDKVNHFLLTGYLPGAIQKKELDTIVDDMRSSLQDGVSTLLSDRQIFATFERRAWNNLHIVACCRPEESAFRTTMQRFPVILSSCQTIWMLPWAGGTLNDVAGIHFSDFSVSLSIEVHELSEYAARVHTLIQEKIDEYTAGQKSQIYITPRTFVAFINAFKSIYETQSKVLEDRLQRIQTALKKLRDAGYQVSEMKSDLLQREGVLQNAIYDTAELLKKISIRWLCVHAYKLKCLLR
jgi:dynein heavy chain